MLAERASLGRQDERFTSDGSHGIRGDAILPFCTPLGKYVSTSRLPRIVGFDVPRLHQQVDAAADEAITALLDQAPDEQWTDRFLQQSATLASQLSLAEVKVEGTRIAFHGSIADARALADAVIALVNRLNDQLMQEGNLHAGEE
ncbi:hypothetical protein SAMN05518671_1538 [Stenotrophomonas lactitubi]|nr:hypothetical protein SAMN04487863_2068 [Stenotrophomonas sp. yr243]SNS68072.1 hypothetical protein SAMN05518671_1538 [Stenotrophomonas lactitubi]